jgi:hypothetical protein
MNELFKGYIKYLLNNHMDKIVDDFIILLPDFKACEIWDTGQAGAEIHLRYRSQIYDYLDAIHNNAFIEIEYKVKKWNEYKIKYCNHNDKELRDYILESYQLLHGILKSYVNFYELEIKPQRILYENLDSIEQQVVDIVNNEFKIKALKSPIERKQQIRLSNNA